MENEIQLANIFETAIKCFYKNLNQIQDAQFRFGRIDTKDKVEGRVVPVDQLVVGAADQAKVKNKNN